MKTIEFSTEKQIKEAIRDGLEVFCGMHCKVKLYDGGLEVIHPDGSRICEYDPQTIHAYAYVEGEPDPVIFDDFKPAPSRKHKTHPQTSTPRFDNHYPCGIVFNKWR